MLDPHTRHWLLTDKGCQEARLLADRHYTRQTVGARLFTRNGQNLVFVVRDLGGAVTAVWVTFRPTPGKASRQDGLVAWECGLFRNESTIQSSVLIREAVVASIALWGPVPRDGFITYVKPEAVHRGRSDHVTGYCFRRAARRLCGHSGDGKPMLRAPRLDGPVPAWTEWRWDGERGGRLRRLLTEL